MYDVLPIIAVISKSFSSLLGTRLENNSLTAIQVISTAKMVIKGTSHMSDGMLAV